MRATGWVFAVIEIFAETMVRQDLRPMSGARCENAAKRDDTAAVARRHLADQRLVADTLVRIVQIAVMGARTRAQYLTSIANVGGAAGGMVTGCSVSATRPQPGRRSLGGVQGTFVLPRLAGETSCR